MGRGNLALSKMIFAALLAVGIAALLRAPVGAREIPPNVRFLIGMPGATCGNSPEQFSGELLLPGPDGWYEDTYRCDSPNCPYGDVERLIFCSYDNFDAEIEQELTQTYVNANGCTAWSWAARPAVYNTQLTGQQTNSWSNLSFGNLWSSVLSYHINVNTGGFCEIVQRIYAPGGLQPPTADLCEDGTELLTSGPVVVSDTLTVSGTLAQPENSFVNVRVMAETGGVGRESGLFTLQSVMRAGPYFVQWSVDGSMKTVTLPDGNLIFEPGGEEIAVAYENYYEPVTIHSICVVPRTTRSDCAERGGVELLNASATLPAYPYTGYAIQASRAITFSQFLVEFTVEDPSFNPARPNGKDFRTGIDIRPPGYSYWSTVRFPIGTTGIKTFTLPFNDGAPLFRNTEGRVSVRFGNYSDYEEHDLYLHSICVLPGNGSPCPNGRLDNPGFDEGLASWDTKGAVTAGSLPLGGFSVANLGASSAVSQTANIETGNVYLLEIRAAATGQGAGTMMTYGTQTTALGYGGPQLFTEAVTQGDLRGYSRNIYVRGAPNASTILASTEAGDLAIDYICLFDSTSIMPDMDCDALLVPWSPPMTGWDILGDLWGFFDYAISWVGTRILWAVCEILRALNRILTQLRNLTLATPMFPNGSDLMSWLEWLGLLLERVGDYIGLNLRQLASWFPQAGEDFANWIVRFLLSLLAWVLSLFGEDADFLLDLREMIVSDMSVFINTVFTEIRLEYQALVRLLRNTFDIFVVLMNGFIHGASGTEVAYIGQDVAGVGQFIWVGVNFINENVAATPLAALNLVAMGIIAWGLGQWTVQKFLRMLEAVAI